MSNPAATRLAQLHRDCAPMLHYYALRLTGGDVHRAEEAVQEAFSRAWRRAGSFDPGDPAARAWLVTTVRNVLIDESRSGWVRKRTDDSTLAERESPLDDIDRMLTGTLLAEALASLSEGHREIIVRSYYGGAGLAELATELQIPLGTAKSRLYYGLRALRAALTERGLTT